MITQVPPLLKSIIYEALDLTFYYRALKLLEYLELHKEYALVLTNYLLMLEGYRLPIRTVIVSLWGVRGYRL